MCRCFAAIFDPATAAIAQKHHANKEPVPESASACWGGRADTIPAYMQLNKQMMMSVEGLRRRDQSLVPASCTLMDKVTVKGTVLGESVSIDVRSKLNNCVVMDNVRIGPNSVIQNSVLCEGTIIGEGCSLNDCQVAPHAEVAAGIKAKSESFNGKEMEAE
uniref:Mannose-1-phosphate guanyltransferase C-terminal domain-containing protein n=1 Tax=Octactis speculum TaxID=3111310 RepID=A0A7S2DBL0_9STRA|mmetsp:Transcript_46556/g.63399  ORF Transcript_46556/g.63399 Transcript_46556/m.63399 type:complete len:161 (+) Transcript_46556:676-1158(+)|eukprot:CAMPEP_0185779710 /NCGR_PEP_ID=MMETSP1174-20130828/96687_1 /TAXON_ID=35687 /ORGANISM="Dictyocha speculum, Strain CCMP1381" /LENGTH=160 /DNA_ID=CAMNT_0028468941 /DNA_START=675 /DNA_END=1157 /DNA_ORIENTATION=-